MNIELLEGRGLIELGAHRDGKVTSADADFAKFKVLVTKADGTTEVKTLGELNITEIDLTGDATHIELPDGSLITGQTTFKRGDCTTGTVADATLVSEAIGYRVEETTSTDGSGNTICEMTAYAAEGLIDHISISVIAPDRSVATNTYGDDDDGVFDRLQAHLFEVLHD